jgi:hypothetical protein
LRRTCNVWSTSPLNPEFETGEFETVVAEGQRGVYIVLHVVRGGNEVVCDELPNVLVKGTV